MSHWKINASALLLIAIFIIVGCRRKDKKDAFTVAVNNLSAVHSTMGAQVDVYAYQDENNTDSELLLYLTGSTNETFFFDDSYSAIRFTVEDRLFIRKKEKGILGGNVYDVYMGDSLSLENGADEMDYIFVDNIFKSSFPDNVTAKITLSRSYARIIKGSTWYLRRKTVEGLDGALADCALDNTLTFNEDNWGSFIYSEGSDVCEADADTLLPLELELPIDFSNQKMVSFIGSLVREESASGIFIDSSTVQNLYLIYPDTLVLSSLVEEGDDEGINDFYFTK